jgi:hypothetical protein
VKWITDPARAIVVHFRVAVSRGNPVAITGVVKDDVGYGVARALREILESGPRESAVRVVICALRYTPYTLRTR